MGLYVIEDRDLPHDIPVIDKNNMGIHIMWMYHNGYRDRAIVEMIDLLERYIKQLIKQCSINYPVTKADEEDLFQECCEELMYRMRNYDPQRSKPNTYFTNYICYKIYTWLGSRFQQISPYYAKKAAKINKAINECNQNNVSYNESKLAAMTDMSPHTIHNTLEAMSQNTDLGLEELDKSTENFLTPETLYLMKEESAILSESLNRLSQIERRILYLKIYCENESGKPFTYKQVAEITGHPITDVKKIMNQALLKLAATDSVKNNYGERYYEKSHRIKRKKITIIPEESADIVEKQILDSMKE